MGRSSVLCVPCGTLFVTKQQLGQHSELCKRDMKVRELEALVASLQQQLVAKNGVITTLRSELASRPLDLDVDFNI